MQERREALAEGRPVPQDLLGVLLTAADELGQTMTDEEVIICWRLAFWLLRGIVDLVRVPVCVLVLTFNPRPHAPAVNSHTATSPACLRCCFLSPPYPLPSHKPSCLRTYTT